MDQPKAVICDDDSTSRLILKRLLEKAGFSVLTGQDGNEGLAMIRAIHPHVVILDLDMPVKGGLQVLVELKQGKDPLPYILVLTAHESDEDRAKVKGLGAQDMLVKPFKPAELIQRLQAVVVQSRPS